MFIPAAILGAAIGAYRSKKGDAGEAAIKGAAVGVLVVFSLAAVAGTAVVGTYAYGVSKYGVHPTHVALQSAMRNTGAN